MSMITVIVPVYNTEAYLGQCVDSLLHQSYSDLEILLVDDGSTDGSGELCERFALKDSRVRVIHQVNGGLSATRNVGLNVVRSPYIGFVDSDDWIHPEMYASLYRDILTYQAQMAVCGIRRVFRNEYPQKMLFGNHPPQVLSGRQALENLLVSAPTGGHTAWNRLYDIRCFYPHIRFPVGRLYEDAFTTYKLLYACKTVTYRPDALYYYRQRVGSITMRTFDTRSMDKLLAAEEILTFVEANCPELVTQAESFKIVSAMRLIVDLLLEKPLSHRLEYEQIYDILNEPMCRSNPYLMGRHRVLLQLFHLSPRLYAMTWRIRLGRRGYE